MNSPTAVSVVGVSRVKNKSNVNEAKTAPGPDGEAPHAAHVRVNLPRLRLVGTPTVVSPTTV